MNKNKKIVALDMCYGDDFLDVLQVITVVNAAGNNKRY